MTAAERIAFEHGRRVVLDRREREGRERHEAWERARQRDYQRGFAHAATNDERAALEPSIA
jgi:hypothetical protein